VPFWIGGDLHRRNLARLTRRASGWIPSPTARRDDIAAGIETLDAALAAADREPGEVRVRIGLPLRPEDPEPLGRLDEVRGLGATDFFVSLSRACPDPEAAPEFLAGLGAAFRAAVD